MGTRTLTLSEEELIEIETAMDGHRTPEDAGRKAAFKSAYLKVGQLLDRPWAKRKTA